MKKTLKTLLLFTLLQFLTAGAYSSTIVKKCSTASGNNVYNVFDGELKIVTGIKIKKKKEEIQSETLSTYGLEIEYEKTIDVQEFNTSGNGSSSNYTVEKITFSNQNGKPMPEPYDTNLNKDGSLTLIFLCEEDSTSMPMPFQP